MHRSFGIETRPASCLWADVIKGPSLGEVRAHVHKLANYRRLVTGAAERKGEAAAF